MFWKQKSSEHNFNCYTGSFTSHVENLKMFLLITTQVALEVAFIYFFFSENPLTIWQWLFWRQNSIGSRSFFLVLIYLIRFWGRINIFYNYYFKLILRLFHFQPKGSLWGKRQAEVAVVTVVRLPPLQVDGPCWVFWPKAACRASWTPPAVLCTESSQCQWYLHCLEDTGQKSLDTLSKGPCPLTLSLDQH